MDGERIWVISHWRDFRGILEEYGQRGTGRNCGDALESEENEIFPIFTQVSLSRNVVRVLMHKNQVELLAQLFPKDSIEYKLLLTYTKKRTTNRDPPQTNGVGEKVPSSTQSQDCQKPKKRKKLRFSKIISCIRPVKEDDGSVTKPVRRQAAADSAGSDQEEVEQIVNKLTKITDCVHFVPSDIEADSDGVVERIVELLREQGDKLNEEIEKNHHLRKQLQESLSYSFFSNVAQTYLQRLSPEELPSAQSPKEAEIALTFELTSRLNALDCFPMNRVLGFGAKYLQDYFSPWVVQQGGYEKVFGTDSDDEEEVQ